MRRPLRPAAVTACLYAHGSRRAPCPFAAMVDDGRHRKVLCGATARAIGLRLLVAPVRVPVGLLRVTVDGRAALVFAKVSDDPAAPAVVLGHDWWSWVRPTGR